MTDRAIRPGARLLNLAGLSSLALASVGLFVVSRGKWSDAIIDSGREWIVPDALARGEVLYRDVVYWFGPFTPYLHAAFFRVFGSSFSTLVLAGVTGSLGILAALFLALRTVTGRREAALWTALAVPALVFMPNAGGPILGMGYRIWHAAAFTLLAVSAASRLGKRDSGVARSLLVGALAAFAGLCRTEWGFLAVGASFLCILASRPTPGARLRLLGGVAAGFLALFGGTVGGFVLAAGRKAVLEDGHLFLAGLPRETRTFLVEFSGIRDWRAGILEMLYAAVALSGVVLSIGIVAALRADRRRALRLLPVLAGALVVLLVLAAAGGTSGLSLFSAAPLLCGVAVVVALSGRFPEAPALAAYGLAGGLACYRRPFHIGDGGYVGPALLFAFVGAAGLVEILANREQDPPARRFRSVSAVTLAVLVIVAFAGRFAQYRADGRKPIPGTGEMLSGSDELVARIADAVRTVRASSRPGEGLVVLPEGEVLNLLAQRPNPIRHKLYIPGYLTAENEPEVSDELDRARPAMVVVWPRLGGEYGRGFFGDDYGREILARVDRDYRPVAVGPARPLARTFTAYRRKDPAP